MCFVTLPLLLHILSVALASPILVTPCKDDSHSISPLCSRSVEGTGAINTIACFDFDNRNWLEQCISRTRKTANNAACRQCNRDIKKQLKKARLDTIKKNPGREAGTHVAIKSAVHAKKKPA